MSQHDGPAQDRTEVRIANEEQPPPSPPKRLPQQPAATLKVPRLDVFLAPRLTVTPILTYVCVCAAQFDTDVLRQGLTSTVLPQIVCVCGTFQNDLVVDAFYFHHFQLLCRDPMTASACTVMYVV